MVWVCEAKPITGVHSGRGSDCHMMVKTRRHRSELRGYDFGEPRLGRGIGTMEG